MAKKNGTNIKRHAYISVPSQIINSISSSSLQSLLVASPEKKSYKNHQNQSFFSLPTHRSYKLWFFTLFLFCLLGMLKLGLHLDPIISFSPFPCSTTSSQSLISNGYSKSEMGVAAFSEGGSGMEEEKVFENFTRTEIEGEFWKQPDGMGYRPCLDFSEEYRKDSQGIVSDRRKYLMVVVAGGLNQQRNQIVDAVAIARILGATLVVPILQVNVIWGDESEFSDIFDLEHFKRVLQDDVRIISSLPSTHVMTRPIEEKSPPRQVSPNWIRGRYLKKLRREGVLLLRGLDSRLSKDLPSDLQKLRCKVAFQALRFAPPILEVGKKLTDRMQSNGPYLALHLRMEKDVWVRTGCLPGLSPKYDDIIYEERKKRPELLTGRTNMDYYDRKLAGLCPLNAYEVKRLLKALGAPKDARIYWAGGEPFGGKEALLPLTQEFHHLYNKEDLALPDELESFTKKASFLAAIDYIVCQNSDVFMPSHGGNMGHALQGQRAYEGHKKYITPNKRHMLPLFLNSSLSESEFSRNIQELHQYSFGQPEIRTIKAGRDVTKYPIPECMCNSSYSHSY